MIDFQGEIEKAAAAGINSGNPIVILGWLAAGLFVLAMVLVLIQKRAARSAAQVAIDNQKTTADLLTSFVNRIADNSDRQAHATGKIAENTTIQTHLLSKIQDGTDSANRQMAVWSDPKWLRDKLDEIHDDVRRIAPPGVFNAPNAAAARP